MITPSLIVTAGSAAGFHVLQTVYPLIPVVGEFPFVVNLGIGLVGLVVIPQKGLPRQIFAGAFISGCIGAVEYAFAALST